MRQFELDEMEEVVGSINTKIGTTITETNDATSKLYNTLVDVTDSIHTTKKKIAIMGDMVTDLKVLTGNTKNNVYLSDLDVVSNTGLTMKDGRITLEDIEGKIVDYNTKTSSILSEKPYRIVDSQGKSKSLDDVFKYKTDSKLSVDTLGFSFTFNFNYLTAETVNRIVIKLPVVTEVYPLISNIQVSNLDGTTYSNVNILNNNSNYYSLDDNRTLGNEYYIDIPSTTTRNISITLSSTDYQYLLLTSIETYNVTKAVEGSLVLGPLVADTPILKASLSSTDASDNVKLEVSTDLNEWIAITDAFKVSTVDTRKIVAFNTINESSFKSEEDIRQIYIKISLTSEENTNIDTTYYYNGYREDGTVSNTVSIDTTRFSAYRVKSDDLSYGLSAFSNSVDLLKGTRESISTLTINGVDKVLGFTDTLYSYGDSGSIYTNVNIKRNHLRLEATSLIDASTFDAINSKLLDINVVDITGEINSISRKDLCFKLKAKEDTYKIIAKDSRKYITKRISSNFIIDNLEGLIQVPYEDIIIMNSIGETINTISKDKLHMVLDGETEVYFLSLIPILYNLPEIEDYTFNELYPVQNLNSDEFGMTDGRIVLGVGSLLKFKNGYRLVSTTINKDVEVNYQNGNTWKRKDTLYTYHHTQSDRSDREKSVIKLDHISIEKGSLSIVEAPAYESLITPQEVYIAVDNQYS